MDNATKALYMVGSLLVALMVISLLVYAFNNLGVVQNEKDKIQSQEEITKFNTEYEAFNKKIMYGVDVISCINKAISNNEKFVDGGSWARGGVAGQEALVQVIVELTDNFLKESIEVYHFNEKGKEVKYMGNGNSDLSFSMKNLKWNDVISMQDAPAQYKLDITSIKPNHFVKDIMNSNDLKFLVNKEYKLLKEDSRGIKSSFVDSGLYELVKHKTDLEIILPNTGNTALDTDSWSYIKWTTCFADFKKRKFKCKDIKYNESTGLIDHITFSEYKN